MENRVNFMFLRLHFIKDFRTQNKKLHYEKVIAMNKMHHLYKTLQLQGILMQ